MKPSARASVDSEVIVPITGMTCGACERRVTRALTALPGVVSAEVSARRNRAVVRSTRPLSRQELESSLESTDYGLASPPWLSPDPKTWVTVAVAAAAIAILGWAATASGLVGSLSALVDPSRGGLILALIIGLTAGVSTCMAMVGGLVLGLSAAHAAQSGPRAAGVAGFARRMRPQVAFNLGRVLGFGILGSVLGLLGAAFNLPTMAMGILALVVAVVMFLLGARISGISPRMATWSPRLPGGLANLVGINEAVSRPYSDLRTGLVGAATFFLPCGFTQAVQVYALSTGSAATAGVIMALFAIGTTPGLLALGSVPEIATGRSRTTVLQAIGVVVLAFSLVNAVSGMRLMGVSGNNPATDLPATISENVTLDSGGQTVRMTQTRGGYTPADTVVQAGVPITWIIDGRDKWDCSAFLRVPDLEVSVNLETGPNTVALPALDPGVMSFTCAMGMYSGTLTAVE